MEKIFHVKKNRFSSTDETLRFIFNRFYGMLNAEIVRNENGKPFLKSKETTPPLFCSVSHTDNELFIAISRKNVGLDVENTHRTVHYEPIIKHFSPFIKEKGKLKNDTIVATIMSNLGLNKFASENKINSIKLYPY